MAHAISYIRFSTPNQSFGDSLRRQLDRTKEYCDKHGLTLDETLRDDGLSGYKGEHVKHGALGRFLAAVEAGRVPRGTYLIIEHLDRFSRQNTRIALTMLLNLINAGIRVVTLFNEQTYSDTSETIEHDLIGAILYMSEAHNASARKADLIKRTWEGHRLELESGKRKVLTNSRPAWVDVDPKTGGFVKNRRGTATVRRIFELVASGMSTYAVCQLLNGGKKPKDGVKPNGVKLNRAKPVPTLTGNKKHLKGEHKGEPIGNGWNTSRISEIIKSDAPLGWFQPHRREGYRRIPVGEPIKSYYPEVVTQELANRARYMLTTRAFAGVGSGRKGVDRSNLFTGICKCGVCGGGMYLYSRGSRGKRRNGTKRYHGGYLRCANRMRNMGCTNNGNIPYDEFERFVVDLIGGFSIPEDEVGSLDQAMQDLIERLAETREEAAKTYDAVKNLLDSFVDKQSPLVMRRIGELEVRHARLTVEIADLEEQIKVERGKTKPSDAIKAAQGILTDMQSPDATERLLARTRVASGMKQFICHFIAFPNRGMIGEYDLGSRGSLMCVMRAWLSPDGEYEVYHSGFDWGQRKGQPWLSFVKDKLHRRDGQILTPVDDWRHYVRDYDPMAAYGLEYNDDRSRPDDIEANRRRRILDVGDMVVETMTSPEANIEFPTKIRKIAPELLELQPEDVVPIPLTQPKTKEEIKEAREYRKAAKKGMISEHAYLRQWREKHGRTF